MKKMEKPKINLRIILILKIKPKVKIPYKFFLTMKNKK